MRSHLPCTLVDCIAGYSPCTAPSLPVEISPSLSKKRIKSQNSQQIKLQNAYGERCGQPPADNRGPSLWMVRVSTDSFLALWEQSEQKGRRM